MCKKTLSTIKERQSFLIFKHAYRICVLYMVFLHYNDYVIFSSHKNVLCNEILVLKHLKGLHKNFFAQTSSEYVAQGFVTFWNNLQAIYAVKCKTLQSVVQYETFLICKVLAVWKQFKNIFELL